MPIKNFPDSRAGGKGGTWGQGLVKLADAVASASLFGANIHFWSNANDYFAAANSTNPLLHLWSLGVEEQFYLVIPVLCIVIWKFRSHLVKPTFAIIAILSLLAAIYAVATGKQGDAFYLLPYRAWELLTGSLIAMLPALPQLNEANEKERPSARYSYLLVPIVGLLLVLTPYVLLTAKTPFPGAFALPSVLGTAMLIRYGQYGWIGKLLSWTPFVFIGRISYSLYLWHWPVTVFWRYVVYDQLVLWDYIGMFLLSLLLSWLSWKYIEMPFRIAKVWTPRRTFAFAATGIILLVTLGTVCVHSDGWPNLRLKANELAPEVSAGRTFVESYAYNTSQAIIRRSGKVFSESYSFSWNDSEFQLVQKQKMFTYGYDASSTIGAPGRPEILLVGDSHAGSLQYGIDNALSNQGRSGYVLSVSGTKMVDLQSSQYQSVEAILTKYPTITKVILAQYWTLEKYGFNSDSPRSTMSIQVEEFAALLRTKNISVFIIQDVPEWDWSPGDIAARMMIIPPRNIDKSWDRMQGTAYELAQGGVNRNLKAICDQTGAVLIPLNDNFLVGDHYISFENDGSKKIPLYRDKGHLSPYGSLRAARFILSYVFPDSG